jgi:hypothetical protein
MKINFNCEYFMDLPDCKHGTIICAFTKLLPMMLADLFQCVLAHFADEFMSAPITPFRCSACGNDRDFSWKTHHGKPTSLRTMFARLTIRQLQIKCRCCGKKMFITRKLLGLEDRVITPPETRKQLALLGSLTTFRVAEKITGMFGLKLCRMSIWRSVQREAESMEFGLDPDEKAEGEADGTGIPIKGIRKRGRELKVFIQKRVNGGVRLAGLAIGKYECDWDKLFKPILPDFVFFKQFLLVTDGDTSILKALGDKVKVIVQRCLWHIPHQLKYCLWQDKVKHKSEAWKKVLTDAILVCSLPRPPDDEALIATIIKEKRKSLETLIDYCRTCGYERCATYLTNAAADMFRAFEKKLDGKTTSLVERVMRIVNSRINVGKWTESGALNVNKIRLAHYYNGYDVNKPNAKEVIVSKAG